MSIAITKQVKMHFKKSKLLELVILKGCFGTIISKNLQQCESELVDTIEEFSIVLTYRYSSPRSWSVPKSSDWYIKILPNLDDSRFKSCVRVTRWEFGNLLDLINSTIIFKKQNNVRLSTEIQLAVALFRFGNDGSGASYRNVGLIFGISDAGTVQACSRRVISALLSMQNKMICWPNQEERKQICNTMKDVLPGCVGYIDGCHIPLFQAPKDNHEAYFSRKQQYALHLQATCDNNLIFRNASVGYPASAHDARVFANTPIGQKTEDYLSEGEWIAADSAYKLTKYIVTPFRDNSVAGTLRQRRNFNRHFSSQRVKIEQSFGILKKIFGSLRSLRISVDKVKGHKAACEWIVACVILYNIIRPENQDDIETSNEENEEQTDTGDNSDSTNRNNLFKWFLSKNNM